MRIERHVSCEEGRKEKLDKQTSGKEWQTYAFGGAHTADTRCGASMSAEHQRSAAIGRGTRVFNVTPLLQVHRHQRLTRQSRIEEGIGRVHGVLLNALDVVAIGADHLRQLHLAHLGQLVFGEAHQGIGRFVPKSITPPNETELHAEQTAEGRPDQSTV